MNHREFARAGWSYRGVWLFIAILVAMTMCLPASIGPSVNSAAASLPSDRYYVMAMGTGGQSVWGIYGNTVVKDSTVIAGSEVAVFLNLMYGAGMWFQVGYHKGVLSNYQTYFYYEYPDLTNGGAIGNYMWHPAQIEGNVYFKIWSDDASLGHPGRNVHMMVQTASDIWYWHSNDIGQTYGETLEEGSAQVESWSRQNTVPTGSFLNLKYQTTLAENGDYPVMSYWTGYKIMYSDSPYVVTQAYVGGYDVRWWTDASSRISDSFYGSDLLIGGNAWSKLVNPGGYVGTDSMYYSPSPYSLKVAKSSTTTSYSYAQHSFPAVSSGTLYAQARLRTDGTCSNGYAYFYVAGGQVTFAFKSGYFAWYDTTWHNLVQFTKSRWYDVTFAISPVGGTYTITIKDLSTGAVLGTWSANLRFSSPHVLGDVCFTAGWYNLGSAVNLWVDGLNVHT